MSYDWSEEDHSNRKLDTANFSKGWFYKTNFSGASLRNAIFIDANLSDTDFSNADLRGADLTGACINGVTFDRANLQGATLAYLPDDYGNMADVYGTDKANDYHYGASFNATNLRFADLSSSSFRSCNFYNADLRGIDGRHAIFEVCDFDEANMAGANLQESEYNMCSFSHTNLRYANLQNATVRESNFGSAIIYFTNFMGADFNHNYAIESLIEDFNKNNENYGYIMFHDKETFAQTGNNSPLLDFHTAFDLVLRPQWEELQPEQQDAAQTPQRRGQLSPDNVGNNAALSDRYRYQRGHIEAFKVAISEMAKHNPNYFLELSNSSFPFIIFDIGSGGGTVLFAFAEFAAEEYSRMFRNLTYYGFEPNKEMLSGCYALLDAIWNEEDSRSGPQEVGLLKALPNPDSKLFTCLSFDPDYRAAERSGKNWSKSVEWPPRSHIRVLFTLSYVTSQNSVSTADIAQWAHLIADTATRNLTSPDNSTHVLITTANTQNPRDKTPELVAALQHLGCTVTKNSWTQTVHQPYTAPDQGWNYRITDNNVQIHHLEITRQWAS